MRRIFRVLAFVFSVVLAVVFCLRALQAEYQIKEIRNVVYKEVDGEKIMLNLFLPQQDGADLKNLPTLIFLDSGCWYSNGPGNGAFWGSEVWNCTAQGYAVVSVGHRSLSNVVFPAQIEDVRAAVRFLRAHAAEYGLDPNRFASMGCSSGGHLSTTLGIADSISPFDVGENLEQSGQVNAVIDFYGPTDFTTYLDHFDSGNPACVYMVLGADSEKDYPLQVESLLRAAHRYSTVNYVNSDYAPTIIFHGVVDPVVPISQSALFYESLRRHGVKSQFIVSNAGVHDVRSLDDLDTIRQQIFDFLKEFGF